MTPDTLPLVDAAARLGKGKTWAYDRVNAAKATGEWVLVDGVRILRIGNQFYCSVYELDRFLGIPQQVSA